MSRDLSEAREGARQTSREHPLGERTRSLKWGFLGVLKEERADRCGWSSERGGVWTDESQIDLKLDLFFIHFKIICIDGF